MATPGEIIKDELQKRGWTQEVFAQVLGRPLNAVNEIIKGKKSITAQTARELEAALGISAEQWLQYEAAFQLARTDSATADIERRSRLFTQLPVPDMVKRGWLRPTDGPDALEAELCRFFGVSSLIDTPRVAGAARAHIRNDALSESQVAWCYRALHLAPAVHAEHYSPSKLRAAIPELRGLAAQPQLVREVPRVLAAAGVRLVIVENLPRMRMAGAALWLDLDTPVIALSLNIGRMDSFWFTLNHEISHILHKDGEMIDVDLSESGAESWSVNLAVENRANDEAAAALIDPTRLIDFIRRKRHLFTTTAVIQFANSIKIHPSIVVGQLQHRRELSWGAHTKLIPQVREFIAGEALTDGFGHRPQVQ